MVGILSYTLIKYYTTKSHVTDANIHPWVTPATLWPTFMLLGISGASFILHLITLCAYSCGVGAANKTDSCASYIGYILTAIHIVVWGVSAGLFKVTATEKSLWGYSCSDYAAQLEQSFVDFGRLCDMQVCCRRTSLE